MGWKYFDFGEDYTQNGMQFVMKVRPNGCSGTIHIRLDSEAAEREIGAAVFERGSREISCPVEAVTGRHAVYLTVEGKYKGWARQSWENRPLLDIESFVFCK